MTRTLAVTIALGVFIASITRGDDREEQFVADMQKLSPELQTIGTGGRWLRGSTVGTFRLLVRQLGFEFQRDYVFLQWIRLADDATESDLVERTVPIAEVHGIITSHRFARAGKDWKLILGSEWLDHAVDPPTKRHGYFVISPSTDYTYSCSESTREPDI
jgi:hypothetical protein